MSGLSARVVVSDSAIGAVYISRIQGATAGGPRRGIGDGVEHRTSEERSKSGVERVERVDGQTHTQPDREVIRINT